MNLKCPSCGGQMVYDVATDKMLCEYCQQKTETKTFTYETEEYMETNIYHCSSCGADLMVNGTEAATCCSYCGQPTIVFSRVSKEVKPKWIIPFKITEAQALESIKERFQEGSYIPKKIKDLTVDKVHAIYMPYWLFTSYLRRRMVIEARTDDEGTYTYYRDASCRYKNVTLDASLRLTNEMSRRLEPFDPKDLVEFDLGYLSGFYADKYDVPADALKTDNLKRCRYYLDDAILDTCFHVNKMTIGKLANYKKKDVHEEYKVENVDYAFLPAYFVNIKYESGNELVIVNGQTGKVVGNLPVERSRIIKKFIKNSLISCPIFAALSAGILWLPNLLPFFAIIAAFTAFMIAGGVSGYKKYKQGRYRMSASNMVSYVNQREDFR